VISAEDRELFGGRRPPAPMPIVDLRRVRVAGHERSTKALTDTIAGVRLDPALQQVGTVLLMLWRAASATDRRRLDLRSRTHHPARLSPVRGRRHPS
jgi:hypothetical protein